MSMGAVEAVFPEPAAQAEKQRGKAFEFYLHLETRTSNHRVGSEQLLGPRRNDARSARFASFSWRNRNHTEATGGRIELLLLRLAISRRT